MTRPARSLRLAGLLFGLTAGGFPGRAAPPAGSAPETPPPPPVVTNLCQLNQLAIAAQISDCAVDFPATVCAVSPSGRVFTLADRGIAQLITLDGAPRLQPGDQVRVQGEHCQLVRHNWGLSLGRAPLVDNDGQHVQTEKSGRIDLPAGPVPLYLQWFNAEQQRALQVELQGPGFPRSRIPDTALTHEELAGNRTVSRPGLIYHCYYGQWLELPNFHSLPPVATSVTTNFNLEVSTRQNYVGLGFEGCLNLPRPGRYTFYVSSDDGSKLFLGPAVPTVEPIGHGPTPAPGHPVAGLPWKGGELGRWVEVEGVVEHITGEAECSELEVLCGQTRMRVLLADRTGLSSALLLNSTVRVRGVAGLAYRPDGTKTFELLQVASARDITLEQLAPELSHTLSVTAVSQLLQVNSPMETPVVRLEGRLHPAAGGAWELTDATGTVPLRFVLANPPLEPADVTVWGAPEGRGRDRVLACSLLAGRSAAGALATNGPAVLTTAEQVQRLNAAEIDLHLPVRLRGVIIGEDQVLHYGNVIQDNTRGIYFYWNKGGPGLEAPAERPKLGEFWEITGVTDRGYFAPDVRAQQMVRLGEGPAPLPSHPTREQVLNGTFDTQLVELDGIVTGIFTNGVAFLMHGGPIRLDVSPTFLEELRPLKDTRVRFRGCLLNEWNGDTHQLILGRVRLANGSLLSRPPETTNPFTAPVKNVDDLLRFDLLSGDFPRVKITGQYLGTAAGEHFLLSGTNGLRFVLREPASFTPGDLVTVVGYPELGGAAPVLREALARQNGTAPLPPPVPLKVAELSAPGLDATYVRVAGTLNSFRDEPDARIYYLQTGGGSFTARLPGDRLARPEAEPGSLLELTGVYLALNGRERTVAGGAAFELLVDSPADIRLLARPPWWTLKRLLVVTGGLGVVLLLAVLWINQLRQRVEERSRQLKHEIREREQAEQERMVAEEKSRIARDLHDDLGSSLTEIGLQAGLAQRSGLAAEPAAEQFRVIADQTRAMVAVLDVIVWAVDPEEDTLQTTVEYMAGYADEFLAASGLERHLLIPLQFPEVKLGGRVRHELFLAVKEALNNIVRHARATAVQFTVATREGTLQIDIADNGAGFEPANATGHGIANLTRRLADLGGTCRIRSSSSSGTHIQFILPLKS